MLVSKVVSPYSGLDLRTRRLWVKSCGAAIEIIPARDRHIDKRDIVQIYGINSRGNASESLEIQIRPEDMDQLAQDWIAYRNQGNILAEIPLVDALIESYIARAGTSCLYCMSNNIEAGSSDFDSDWIRTIITCNDCNMNWVDIYTLTGVDV